MNRLEEMLLRNGLICHNSSGERLYLEGSLLQGSLVVRNASGYVTHRVRKASNGVDLVLVNTKGDHSNLSHEYAAVPNEIKDVGKQLNVDYLADSTMDKLLANIKDIRETVKNDRAILRAFHFYNEDKRAVLEAEACKNKDIDSLLKLMNESGRSSYEYLQNVYPASRPTSQALAIGLALSDYYLQGKGAYRVHGGGFDGTIQVVVPKDMLEEYKKFIGSVFGDDALLQVRVRPFGTKLVI